MAITCTEMTNIKFYKAVHHNISGLKIPDLYKKKETLVQSTRLYHHLHFSIPFINTNRHNPKLRNRHSNAFPTF